MATGYLLNDDPYVDVSIPAFGGTITLNCLIDTGFTGFLSVSLVDAFPLGLILFGTTDVTLADGSTVSKITCLGAAIVDGERKFGLFLVHPNKGGPALGMEFLKIFNLRLVVDPINQVVELEKVQPPAVAAASPPAIEPGVATPAPQPPPAIPNQPPTP